MRAHLSSFTPNKTQPSLIRGNNRSTADSFTMTELHEALLLCFVIDRSFAKNQRTYGYQAKPRTPDVIRTDRKLLPKKRRSANLALKV